MNQTLNCLVEDDITESDVAPSPLRENRHDALTLKTAVKDLFAKHPPEEDNTWYSLGGESGTYVIMPSNLQSSGCQLRKLLICWRTHLPLLLLVAARPYRGRLRMKGRSMHFLLWMILVLRLDWNLLSQLTISVNLLLHCPFRRKGPDSSEV
jgi:hypothetical protein